MSEGELLIELMERDLAIARAQKCLDELPEKTTILKLRQRIREIAAIREKADAQVHRADAAVKQAEDEAASLQEKIDAEQAKVLSGEVANAKELQTLTRALDSLGRRKDAVERQALDLMEKADEARAQLAKIDATLEEGARREAELIEVYKEKGGALQMDVARLNAARAKLAAQLGPHLIDRYESVRASKHGIAVGVFDGSLCSACRTQIPSGQAQALSAGPPIAECPNCHRILIVRRTDG